MNKPLILQYVTAIGAVATPLLVLVLTSIGWRLRKRIERQFEIEDRQAARRRELEDKLRSDRIETYNQILEPFIILLMTDAAWQANPKNKNKDRHAIASQTLLSLEYRQQGFKLSLVGSDAVVTAYNDLMQYFFHRDETSPVKIEDIRDMMDLLGNFLLEVRRSTGNESTELDNWQMLEWFLTDARTYRNPQVSAS